MDIRSVAAKDVEALLAAAGLPVDDLGDDGIELWGAFEDRLLGVVGVQWLDGAALLRSLAVDPATREHGLGAKLCGIVEARARERKLSELWLLTTSARDYFARRGYEAVPREHAPVAVRATAQFTSLCPATATVMRRSL